jgi:hypothetical protein
VKKQTSYYDAVDAAARGRLVIGRDHFSIGIGFGVPGYWSPPPPMVAYAPPFPGPGYTWVTGY